MINVNFNSILEDLSISKDEEELIKDWITSILDNFDTQELQTKKIKFIEFEITSRNPEIFTKVDFKFRKNNNLYLISGRNDSGKTTTIELMIYTLFKDTQEQDIKEYIKNRISKLKLKIEIDGLTYTVNRDLIKKKDIYESSNGDKLTSDKYYNLFSKIDKSTIRDLLINFFYIQQDDSKQFFLKSRHNSFEILQLFNNQHSLSIIKIEKIKKAYVKQEDEIKNNEDQAVRRRRELLLNKINNIQQSKNLILEVIDNDSEIKILNKQITEKEKEIRDFKSSLGTYLDDLKKLKRVENELKWQIETLSASELVSTSINLIAPDNCLFCSLELTEDMKNRLNLKNPHCPLCNREIELTKNDNSIDINMENINNELMDIKEKIKLKLKDKKTLDARIQNEESILTQLEQNHSNLRNKFGTLKFDSSFNNETNPEIEEIDNLLESYKSQLQELKRKIELTALATLTLNRLFSNFYFELQRKILLKTKSNFELLFGSTYSENYFKITDFELKAEDQDISETNQGAFRHLLTIAHLLAIHEVIQEEQGIFLFPFIIDEPERHLDEEEFSLLIKFFDEYRTKIPNQIIISSNRQQFEKISTKLRPLEKKDRNNIFYYINQAKLNQTKT